jgi:hypothetical protein
MSDAKDDGMGEPLVRYVDPRELRQRFNDGDYASRAAAGEFAIVLRRESHPTLAGSTEPFCTRSQILAYLDQDGERIAVVHRYLRADGTLGGSGRPDPKMLIEDGVIYRILEPKKFAG